MQFSYFLLNFLNQIKVFLSNLKMVCFVGVIDIILMLNLMKKSLLRFKRFKKMIKLHQFSKK